MRRQVRLQPAPRPRLHLPRRQAPRLRQQLRSTLLLTQFYLLVLGSALVDALTIYSSSSQPDKFTFLFMPLLEIGLKLAAIAASVFYDRKREAEGG